MATIIKRNGKWQVKIRKNNFKQLSKTFITKDNAIKWARETEGKVEKGLFEDLSQANSITLRELLQQYKSDETSKKKGAYSEVAKIDKLCRQDIVKCTLAKITPLKIKTFRDEWLKTHNPSTVNKYLTLINIAIKYARDLLGIYLPNNPCDYVKRLKEPEFEGQVIEQHEEELLLKHSEKSKASWLKLAIMLGIDCGLRRGEVLSIQRSDVSFNKSTAILRDTKNGTSRAIGLSPRVIEEMEKLPVALDGKLINCRSEEQFKFYWKQLKRWANINKTFHSTRHTFASRMAMKGWTITEIAQQGGWKELKVLKRYTHLKAEYLADKLKQRPNRD